MSTDLLPVLRVTTALLNNNVWVLTFIYNILKPKSGWVVRVVRWKDHMRCL